MLRRTMMLLMAGDAATSCTRVAPTVSTIVLPSAPPPTKIERLLIWFPANDSAVDAKKMADAFAVQLAPFGVAVKAGRSTALELDRGDDQKPFVVAFKPTHRLEIDVAGSVSIGGMAGTNLLQSALRVSLYDANGKTPIRAYTLPHRPNTDSASVTLIVEKLKADGYL